MTDRRRNRDPQALRDRRDALMADIDAGRIGFGEAVRRMREISGLTQPEFARHRRISLPTLKQLEAGVGNPTVATLEKVGGIFGLRVAYVRRRNGEAPND